MPPPTVHPSTVRFEVDLGPRFTFSKIHINLAPDAPQNVLSPPTPESVKLVEGEPYSAGLVVQAGESILTRYKQTGTHFRRSVTVTSSLISKRITWRSHFRCRRGSYARFGPTRVTGLTRLKDPMYMR